MENTLMQSSKVEIHFVNDDGTEKTYVVPNNKESCYIESLYVEEQCGEQNNNPIGVVSSGILNITLQNVDRCLMESNESSVYYNYKRTKAWIQLTVTDKTHNNKINFQKFYISSWEESNSSSEPYKIDIEAYDVLNKICGFEFNTPKKNIMNPKELLEQIITGKNYGYEIELDDEISLPTYKNMTTLNISSNNIQDALNEFAQSCLISLFINHDNVIKSVDFEDDGKQPVFKLNSSNVYNCRTVPRQVYYNKIAATIKLNNAEQPKNVYGSDVFSISSELIDINKTHSIQAVVINGLTSVPESEPLKFSYNRNKVKFTKALEEGTFNAYISKYKEVEKTEFSSKDSEIADLQITNVLITNSDDLNDYVSKLKNIIDNVKRISVSYYPKSLEELNLGNNCDVDLSVINVKGTYRLKKVKWNLSSPILTADVELDSII